MSRSGNGFVEHYGGFRVGETAEALRARVSRIDEIHRLLAVGAPSEQLFEELASLVGDPAIDMAASWDFPEQLPGDAGTMRRRPTRPLIRYIYFLQRVSEPADIKIGVADDLANRFRQHRREFGELRPLGAMFGKTIAPTTMAASRGRVSCFPIRQVEVVVARH